MIGQRQLIQSNVDGDCMRACICSILEIQNLETLPNIDDPQWSMKWDQILSNFGLEMIYQAKPFWVDGYWMASVPSLNYANDGTTHAIVMHHTKVAWDPSLAKRYRKGTNLLGKDVVLGGYNFFVSDAARLPALDAYRKGARSVDAANL